MENLLFRGATINVVSCAFAEGSGTNTITHSTASRHVIDGKWMTSALGAVTNSATCPTTDAGTGAAFIALAANQASVFVFGADIAGNIKALQGSVEDTYAGVTTTVGDFKAVPQFPAIPDTICPMAYVVVRTAPDAAAWTFGTSDWGASGVTVETFRNIAVLPARPQTTA